MAARHARLLHARAVSLRATTVQYPSLPPDREPRPPLRRDYAWEWLATYLAERGQVVSSETTDLKTPCARTG